MFGSHTRRAWLARAALSTAALAARRVVASELPGARTTREPGRSTSSCDAAATTAAMPRRPTPPTPASPTRSSATWRP